MEKYERLRARVLAEGIAGARGVLEPPRAAADELLRVHTSDYIERIRSGTVGESAMRRIGFPWSEGLVERSLRTVGGTIAAARAALEAGVAMNLSGGTHHAFADHGEGFCVFNDVAIAIRTLQDERRIRRAAIVDLDVHQGNGTHAIFSGDDTIYTFSMHGERNYPFRKVPGRRDIALPDGTKDAAYLDALREALPGVLAEARADLVFFIAGADPHEGDRLGRLALTLDGLARRDAMVLGMAREVGIPVAVVIGGGYGRVLDTVVAAHMGTARVAASFA